MIIENKAPLLFEAAWEVCNQVGGIYTVIRSKVPVMVNKWADRYALIGPYVPANVAVEFEPSDEYDNPVGRAVLKMREEGFEVYYGYWLITGRPRVVLFNPHSVYDRLRSIRYDLWRFHGIPLPENSELVNGVVAFGYLVREFFRVLVQQGDGNQPVIAHFHEWMASSPLLDIRKWEMPVKTVFTTHATQLGRYLAGNDPNFYNNLPHYNWQQQARHFGIEGPAAIERLSALYAHVFTTVSDITGRECEAFLGRRPDLITPNGLNIQRFVAMHEFQNLHKEYKEKINQFVLGHFFHSYKFDLEETVYLFTSGRYEYNNKGYDLTLEALRRLNMMMKRYNVHKTVVAFFITKRPFHTINPVVLQSRAQLEEIRQTVEAIKQQIGDKLFLEVAAGTNPKLPPIGDLLDDYWKMRLRRNVQAWKSKELPIVVTHILKDDYQDEILHFIRRANMVNAPEDPVKIVYHPDFIVSSNPLFGMDYNQFVRGCNLGIFPSYYEPWGYTPLECLASGIPSVTSDLAGFGDYVIKNISNHQQKGMYVVRRYNRSMDEAANELTDQLFSFVKQSTRERIQQRNQAESAAEEFDWRNLGRYYDQAHGLAMVR